MKRFFSILFLSICVGFTFSSCNVRIGDFTAISTKNVDIGSKYVKTGTFEAEDAAWIILVIPTGVPNLKTAVDKCLEAGGGEFATNVVLTNISLPLILATKTGYGIKADVWKRASTSDLSDPNQEIFEMRIKADGTRELISTKNSGESYAVYNGMNAEIAKMN